MTGLNANSDTILSVACFVTDDQLNLLDHNGYEAVIYHSPEDLAKMNDWCVKTHTASGLVRQCISSKIDAETASTGLLEYIKHWVPRKGNALLAGNSVHADKMFLMLEPWKKTLGWLHYRILDVSAIKEAVRRWTSDEILEGIPKKQLKHEAKADILESIEEARYYQSLFQQMQQVFAAHKIGSFNSSSTLSGEFDSLTPVPAGFNRKDSYGNIISPEAARIEAVIKAKRKAADAGLSYPPKDNGRPIPGAGLGSINRGYRGEIDDGSADHGFRTDVP